MEYEQSEPVSGRVVSLEAQFIAAHVPDPASFDAAGCPKCMGAFRGVEEDRSVMSRKARTPTSILLTNRNAGTSKGIGVGALLIACR